MWANCVNTEIFLKSFIEMKTKIYFFFVLLSALIVQSVNAQSFIVKGQVKSQEDSQPLIGVAVMQEGTTNGVTTDFDGNYVMELKGAANATLVFSYVGMKTQKHVVNAQTNVLNVVLTSDTELMDEVVVVAYGVRKKGTIAGSVSTVKAEKMENVPAAGFDQALQGQIRQEQKFLCLQTLLLCTCKPAVYW